MIKIFTIIPLLIGKSKDGFRGRTTINDEMLVDFGDTIEALKTSMKSVIYMFEGIHVDDFEITFETE